LINQSLRLKPGFIFNAFPDNSGMVFFNTFSGESIAFAFTEDSLARTLLFDIHTPQFDDNLKMQLEKVLDLSNFDVESLNNDVSL